MRTCDERAQEQQLVRQLDDVQLVNQHDEAVAAEVREEGAQEEPQCQVS